MAVSIGSVNVHTLWPRNATSRVLVYKSTHRRVQEQVSKMFAAALLEKDKKGTT